MSAEAKKKLAVLALTGLLLTGGCKNPMSGLEYTCADPGTPSTCGSGWVCEAVGDIPGVAGRCRPAVEVADPGSPDGGQDTAVPDPGSPDPGCTPDCAGRECGEDGCRGSCGQCAEGASCTVGQCRCVPADCDDGDPCTVDQCVTRGACTHAAGNDGAPCGPGTCEAGWFTPGKTCQSGACTGGGGLSLNCDDGKACTTDSCVAATGCGQALQAGQCLIGGACHAEGDAKSGDACQVCAAAKSTTGWSAAADGTGCGTGRFCGTGQCQPEMVWVPAGPFQMGCNDTPDGGCSCDGDSDECPYHEVTLGGYWIDKHEVTVEAYGAWLDAEAPGCLRWDSGKGGCVASGGGPGGGDCAPGTATSCNGSGKPQHPRNCIDWCEAKAYCEWAGKRLCTEAEWERAARGEEGGIYPWGDASPDCTKAVYLGCRCDGGNCEVGRNQEGGSTAASPVGARDMAGNVSEWVSDWFGSDYYCKGPSADIELQWTYCGVGEAPYQKPWEDPKGPENGSLRVFRGGDFDHYASRMRASSRYHFPYDYAYYIGARCCRSP